MKLSRLTPAGITKFSEFLDEVRVSGVGSLPVEIITDPELSQIVTGELDMPAVQFSDRLAAAVYVDELIELAGLSDIERDDGFWAWLSAYHFSALCPTNTASGALKPGERARWIPEPTNFRRYYRHLLAGPTDLQVAQGRSESGACAPMWFGQRTRRSRRAACVADGARLESSARRAGQRLYVDPASGRLKRGAGGKGPGSPRRLADIVNQFDLTFDLYGMTTTGLQSLLPKEFDRFLS